MTRISITNRSLNFNAGHFTIFSSTEREDLHGHSYFVNGEFLGSIDDNGLAFNYKVVKKIIKGLCDELDEKVLLPEQSPHLKLGQQDGYVTAKYDGEKLMFLPRDVLTLPVRNVTLEELSGYFARKICEHPKIAGLAVEQVTMTVLTMQGQSASTTQELCREK